MSSVVEEESLFSEESPVSLVPVVSELESSVRSDELSSLREPVLSSASLRSSDTVPEESSSVSVMLEESVPSVLLETLPDTSLVSLVWLEVPWVSSLLEQAAADKSSAEAISKAKKG